MELRFFCISCHTTAHFHPFDPYAPHDPNNGYPQHFCDLNDDEFGRPYLGPFDQHVNSSARNPFPKVPPPDNQPQYQTLPPELEELLDGETDVYTRLPSGEVMKRQSPPLPGCTTLNECSMPPRRSCTVLLHSAWWRCGWGAIGKPAYVRKLVSIY